MAEPDGSQMAIRVMCSACWVTKVTYICTYTHTYTHTHSHLGNVMLIAFAKQVFARKGLTVTFTHPMHILVWYNLFGHCRLEPRKSISRFMIPIYE